MLGPESKALVQHYQDEMMLSLQSYTQNQYPLLPLRLSQILMHIGSIKLVSGMWWKHAKMEQLKNKGFILSRLFD